MNKNLWIGVVLIVVVVGGLYFYQKPAAQTNASTIKIGAMLPLTGDYAFLGEEVRRGIELGVEQANLNGGNLLAVYEDDKGDFGAGEVSAANKLLNVDNAAVVFTMLVEEAKPVIPVFENKKTPFVVLWDSNQFIEQAGKYIFSNGFSTEKAGETMAQYAFDTLRLRRVAVLQHNDAWADIIVPSFVQKFQALGGTITFQEKVDSGTTDYRTVIAKMKATNPDGVYFPLIPPTSAQFLIQAQQYKLPGVMLTGDPFIQDVITQVGTAANDVYFTGIYTDEKERLTTLYRAKYGSEPADVTLVSMGYDGVTKIVEASSKNHANLYDGMLSVFGTTRSSNKTEKIYQVKNGIPTPVQ